MALAFLADRLQNFIFNVKITRIKMSGQNIDLFLFLAPRLAL